MKRVLLFSQDRDRAEAELVGHRGRVTHRFRRLLVARVPDSFDPGALHESTPVGDAGLAVALDALEHVGVQALHDFEARRISGVAPLGDKLPWDAPGFLPPRTVPTPVRAADTQATTNTSGYLEGRVAVGLVVVSGPGDLEFSQAETTTVLSQVIEGLDYLVSAEPTAFLAFDVELQLATITAPADPGCTGLCGQTYEGCEAIWRNPAMGTLGYPEDWQGVLDYVADLQAQPGIAWAYAAYFTKYPLCWFAYASIGGPRLVMQYANGSWGPENIHRVFAHETGHLFFAQDEYKDSHCVCGSKSGYWQAPNNNCASCSGGQVTCLMNNNDPTLCFWSRRQLGWGGFGPKTDVTSMNAARTSAAPALAEWNAAVYMAYRGADSADLWSCRYDGTTWHPQARITDENDARTSAGPSLAAFGGALYLAFRGADSSAIYTCSFDGVRWSATTCVTGENGARAATTPAICAYGGKLYLVLRGESSSAMELCSFDGARWSATTSVTAANGARTDATPALAVFQDRLWVAYVGEGGSKLHAFSYDGQSFSSPLDITDENGARATGGPALAAFNGYLYMLYRGDATSSMSACAFDGATWLPPWSVTEQNTARTSARPGLAPLSPGGVLVASYRGEASPDLWSFQVFPDAPLPGRQATSAETRSTEYTPLIRDSERITDLS